MPCFTAPVRTVDNDSMPRIRRSIPIQAKTREVSHPMLKQKVGVGKIVALNEVQFTQVIAALVAARDGSML
jgi:hypothetical protein